MNAFDQFNLADWDDQKIVLAFLEDRISDTLMKPGKIVVSREHGGVFINVEDHYYEVEDQEANRTWSVHETVDENTLAFEEI